MDAMVRVKNTSERPFVGQYLGDRTVIAPGENAILAKEAAITWFGNPSAIDHYDGSELKDDRTREVERLDTRYGIFTVNKKLDPYTEPCTREVNWPSVEVTDLDGKETYPMVVNDPAGEGLKAHSETQGSHSALLTKIEEMSRQIEAMQAEASRAAPRGDVGTDTPVARRGRSA